MSFKHHLQGLFFIPALLFAFSCTDTLESEVIVYSNDFGDLNLDGFEGARLLVFQNDTISGFYNNEEVVLTVDDLPSHNLIKVTVDIIVHDTWDGNPDDGISGPDYWVMGLDDEELFRTTFSNSPCESTFCLYQSYPDNYTRQYVPKTGAIQTNMPGLCIFGAFDNYSTRYSISKTIEHSDGDVKIQLWDELRGEGNPDPACDESWSIAQIEVSTLVVN